MLKNILLLSIYLRYVLHEGNIEHIFHLKWLLHYYTSFGEYNFSTVWSGISWFFSRNWKSHEVYIINYFLVGIP